MRDEEEEEEFGVVGQTQGRTDRCPSRMHLVTGGLVSWAALVMQAPWMLWMTCIHRRSRRVQ